MLKTLNTSPKRQIEFEFLSQSPAVRFREGDRLRRIESLHCKCLYGSASMDHSSHVFTDSEVYFAEEGFGWCSIQSKTVAKSVETVLMQGSTPEHKRLSP
jgi:hypothetical protein